VHVFHFGVHSLTSQQPLLMNSFGPEMRNSATEEKNGRVEKQRRKKIGSTGWMDGEIYMELKRA